jgi:serine/threonine protein kinase
VHLEREIGRGGFGAVYVGTYGGRVVAVKELLRTDIQSAEVRLFSREIAILRKLRSPFIVEFIGAHFAPPKFCIVMEFMPRGSLRRVLADRQLPDDRRVPALLVRRARCGGRGMACVLTL